MGKQNNKEQKVLSQPGTSALRFRDISHSQKQEERVPVSSCLLAEARRSSNARGFPGVPAVTLFWWQKTIRDRGGRLETLVPKSTAPKRRPKRVIPDAVKEVIPRERSHEKIGKEKLARLLQDDSIANLSVSAVGQHALGELKQKRVHCLT